MSIFLFLFFLAVEDKTTLHLVIPAYSNDGGYYSF